MKSQNWIKKGFYLAGAYNLIGILGFTQFFSDQRLAMLDPVVFSIIGQIGIILWGLAYLSVSHRYTAVPHLIAVFCLEKIVYAAAWAYWLCTQADKLNDPNLPIHITTFFRTYGIGDFLFAIFFAIVAIKGFKALSIKGAN